MAEIALLSILLLAAACFAGLEVWARRRKRKELEMTLFQRRAIWEAETRRELHEQYNEEYLKALRDAEEGK